MDFKTQNDEERNYYEQNFSVMNELLKLIRNAIITDTKINIEHLNFDGIIDFIKNETLVYISLFQQGQKFIRYGCKRKTFQDALNRNIEMLKKK